MKIRFKASGHTGVNENRTSLQAGGQKVLRNLLSVTAVLSVVSSACGPGEEAAPVSSIPIGTPTVVAIAPLLSVGVLEGDSLEEFYRVVTPFLLPDGRLVVPLRGSGTLRVFGPGGEVLESLGRPGRGPGEFVSLSAAWPRGDTIEAFDRGLLRITRFLTDGSVETVRLEGPALNRLTALPGTLSNGWAFARVAASQMGGRDEMMVHGFALDGTYLGEVAQVEGMARYEPPGGGSGPDPLSPRAVFAVGGSEIYVGETLTPSVRVLELTGALVREITWERDGTLSAEEAFRMVVDSASARTDRSRQSLEAFPVRDPFPAFGGFIVDDEQFLWVRPYEPLVHSPAFGGLAGAGPGGEWLIFSPEGVQVGSVALPSELEPHQITSDAVVGIVRDELGVESVRVHSLARR